MLLVFGSINLDLSFRTARLPAPGETVLGQGLLISPGGKGANQAHATRRYGMATALVAAVGDDALAGPALALLRAAGVDLQALQTLNGATGCASIAVDEAGHNQIVVAPGVNLALAQSALSDALLQGCGAVLCQMETDVQQTAALLRRARQAARLTLLNNAPAQALAPDMRADVDVLIVNAGELAVTARGAGLDPNADPAQTLQALAGARASVVLTLGERGAMAWHAGALHQAAAWPVKAIDSTGAGDTFCGVLAAALLQGLALPQAMRIACCAASLACTRAGAQAAQPTGDEILAAIATYAPAGPPQGRIPEGAA